MEKNYNKKHYNLNNNQRSTNANSYNTSKHYYHQRSNRYRFNYKKSTNKHKQSNQSIDYSKLPNIVLTKIYSYLNLKDRLNASTTCKSWRMGLFNPSLWQNSTLTIYLLNRYNDLNSCEFKTINLLKYAHSLVFKYDPNDLGLFEHMCKILSNLNSLNLKCVSLQPILVNLYDDYNEYYEYNYNSIDNNQINLKYDLQNKQFFGIMQKLVSNLRSLQHLSLGLIDDLDLNNSNLVELINCLNNKHLASLRSVHLTSCKNMSSLTLISNDKFKLNKSTKANAPNGSKFLQLSSMMTQFVNLTCLSLDYEHLTNEFLIKTAGLLSLKNLNLNVNSINNSMNNQETRIKDESWSFLANQNKQLRVKINFLVVEETSRKFNLILQPCIPLETLRMYFCKSLNPDLLQFLSNNYCETLKSLVIVDAITDPTLRYHNPLRHDADPDPLVLLCWKCKYLNELVLVGYEILEINIIAIVKLRNNLKTFCVPMDCIIDLRYGKFKNDDFIEDEDGEDTIVDYGYCSQQVIKKVCKILSCDNWHPLEKDELPLCVYDYDLPYEEAYLETLLTDQNYNY